MKLIVIYGGPATGKYTVGKALSEMTGLPLFHNHLIVDAVMSVFPFGTPNFILLREQFWLETMEAAAIEGKSLIFTFQPESSVTEGFIPKLATSVTVANGDITWAHLVTPAHVQEARLVSEDRARFGKLRDIDLLRRFRDDFEAREMAMPDPDVYIDTSTKTPEQSARRIAEAAGLAIKD